MWSPTEAEVTFDLSINLKKPAPGEVLELAASTFDEKASHKTRFFQNSKVVSWALIADTHYF